MERGQEYSVGVEGGFIMKREIHYEVTAATLRELTCVVATC